MFNVYVLVKVVLATLVASMSRRRRTITQLAFEVLRSIINRTDPVPPNLYHSHDIIPAAVYNRQNGPSTTFPAYAV